MSLVSRFLVCGVVVLMNAYSKALHRMAIPLRFIHAGELNRDALPAQRVPFTRPNSST
jgi:hypothetical protein